jgi:acyl carrier protein
MNTLNRESLTSEIKRIVYNISFAHLEEQDELLSSKVLDSINVIDLSVELENTFNVKIPFVDINAQHFGSIEKITRYISTKLSI